MGKLKYLGVVVLAAAFIAGFSFKTGSTIPDNAIILVDVDKKAYYSPTYLRDCEISSDNLVLLKCEDIIGKGYEPDSKCKNAGYFSAEDHSSFIVYKAKQLLGMDRKRWNEDGSWNW